MCGIYVGNYPNTYNRDDVLNLFEDFEGIVLRSFMKKDRKCYSFLMCVDETQLLDVVTTMSNLIVDGRNLIVRAEDHDLQYIIENALEKAATSVHERYKNTSRNTFQQQVHKTRSQDNAEHQWHFSGHGNSAQQFQELSDTVYSDVETASSVSLTSVKLSSLSSDDIRSILDQGSTELAYVSILNFPLRTRIQDLYELFEDFDPVKIVMICNEPRKDRKLTEAIVCLSNEDNAMDAIMNLDNTMYRRRVILVNDFKDFSLVPELLNIAKSNYIK